MEGAGKGVSLIRLHPLVIINISDHFTRTAAQNGQGMEGMRYFLDCNIEFGVISRVE